MEYAMIKVADLDLLFQKIEKLEYQITDLKTHLPRKEYYSAYEVAQIFSVSQATVLNWYHAGELAGVQVSGKGGHVKFSIEAIHDYQKQQA